MEIHEYAHRDAIRLRDLIRAGEVTAAEVEVVARRALLDAHNRVSRAVGAFFAEHDLLVTPTLAQPPARRGTLDYDDERHSVERSVRTLLDHGPFTAPFNVSGQPSISLPLGHSRAGLPIGVQVVAASGRED